MDDTALLGGEYGYPELSDWVSRELGGMWVTPVLVVPEWNGCEGLYGPLARPKSPSRDAFSPRNRSVCSRDKLLSLHSYQDRVSS